MRQMNLHAAALGLSDTRFANPIGLDQRGNHSSARDLATLTRHLLRIPVFARIAASRAARLRSVRPPRRIVSINELLSLAPWVTGVKTGHTFDAGYVLVGSGRRRGVELISVVIGAPTDEARFQESLTLLEMGFAQYRRRLPIRAGQDLADVTIRYSGGELPLRAARTVAAGVRRGQSSTSPCGRRRRSRGRSNAVSAWAAPRSPSTGSPAGSTALRAGRAIPAAGAFDRARGLVREHAALAAVVLFVILIGAVLLWRTLRRRRARGR